MNSAFFPQVHWHFCRNYGKSAPLKLFPYNYRLSKKLVFLVLSCFGYSNNGLDEDSDHFLSMLVILVKNLSRQDKAFFIAPFENFD